MTVQSDEEDSRSKLLEAMLDLERKAKSPDEFTPVIVAKALGISKVWMYKQIGPEFKAARARLKRPKSSHTPVESQLRKRNRELEEQLKTAKQNQFAEIKDYYAKAIRQIETLDQDNRSLLAQLSLCQRRLAEARDEISALVLKNTTLELQLVNNMEDAEAVEKESGGEISKTGKSEITITDNTGEYSN